MTGYFESNKYQPISRVSIAALDDLGVYTVDYDAADAWPYTGSRRRLGAENGRGVGNGRSWKVLQTKASFRLPDLMLDLTDPVELVDVHT